MGNIFEELDILMKYGSKSIFESKEGYEELPIAPNMMTADQAREYIREYFKDQLNQLMGIEIGGGMPPMPPSKIEGAMPPPPPISKEGGDGGDGEEPKDWGEDETVWDLDEFMEKIKLEKEKEEKEKEEKEKDFDDFLDKEGGDGSGEGEGDDGDEDEDGEKDEDPDGEGSGDDEKEDDEKDGDGDGEGEGDEKEGGDSKKSEPKVDGGDGDSRGKGDTELKDSIKDAIERLKERADADKERLKDLTDMIEGGGDPESLDDVEQDIVDEHDGKRGEKLRDLVGKMEETPSEEDIKKEIEDSKLSEEDKRKLLNDAKKATTEIVMDDEETKKLKTKAIEELEKKCEGHSKLSSDILYHALKDAKIKSEDWEKIIEMILKDRSVHKGGEESKITTTKWGNKNHLWRDAVMPGHTTRIGGADTQSIYCFVDYSGSVRSRANLIISFLGKVMELCINLQYTDMVIYTFADALSLPKRITKSMIDKDGYEKVLVQVIAYFEEPENDVGRSIEDFSLVANEINKIKSTDKEAVAFIFGDGVWTFYGNRQPPVRLKEMAGRWLDDMCAFVFYDDGTLELLRKEITCLTDTVGLKHVITTKISDIKPLSKK